MNYAMFVQQQGHLPLKYNGKLQIIGAFVNGPTNPYDIATILYNFAKENSREKLRVMVLCIGEYDVFFSSTATRYAKTEDMTFFTM